MLGLDPLAAVVHRACSPARVAGVVNGLLTVGFGLPAFIATLGMFYIARGLAAWLVAGQQLTGFPEASTCSAASSSTCSPIRHVRCRRACCRAFAEAVSVQTLWMVLVAIVAGIVLGYTPFGQQVYATGGNLRAAAYAGINTNRVRFLA